MKDYNKFENLNYDDFKRLAKDKSLSKYEKIGFPNSYRENFERDIWMDIITKLPMAQSENKVIVDIGCGCSDIALYLIDLCEKQKHTLIMIDSEEMLALLPDKKHVRKIAGYFPDMPEFIEEFNNSVDYILSYSVFHYIFEEGNIFSFLDNGCGLLKSGGKFLIGDIPNYTKRSRFFLSDKGIESHRQFVEDATALPELNTYKLDKKRIDDGVLFGIISRYRNFGFETYLLPQDEKLPMANRREDILIEKR